MIADFVRDDARAFPAHPDPSRVTALRMWHCKYASMEGLSAFGNLKTLIIASYPDAALGPIASLSNLEYLSIVHMPKVSDLSPVSQLLGLQTIRLSTLPSWDSSGKKTIVRSLAPLATLPRLAHVELFGVRPDNGSLHELESSLSLQTVRVSKYSKSEKDRFYSVTQLPDAYAPSPEVPGWN